jgi:hypothetical protein
MRARIALAMAVVICGVAAAGPALADRGGRHRGRWGHERHDRGWHGHHRHFFYSSEPDVYYAPPPVVYAPAYPSPGINFIFPLRIR